MKNVITKWNSISLILRIFVGLLIGAALGFATHYGMPDLTLISLMGTLFVNALKAVAPILVLFLVASALIQAKAADSMKTILVLYIIGTFVAALVAVAASFLFPSTITLTGASVEQASPAGIGEVLTNIMTNITANPIKALTEANYVGILTWGILLGVALRGCRQATQDVFTNMADAISKIVRWVIALAPFGIMGLVYSAVMESGLDIFVEYGHLLLVLVGCMAFIAFVANPIIAGVLLRQNPYPLVLRCLKDSFPTAFFTRSSAANIPVNMELCRKLGLNKDLYSVSIPLGATINMAGAAVTIAVMTMATTNTLGITVDIPTAVILCVLAAVSACGASGVAGGSLLLIPLACSLFGIGNDIAMQVVGIGFIIGVVQDSFETGLNSSSDVLFTAVADYMEKKKLNIPFKVGKDAEGVEEVA